MRKAVIAMMVYAVIFGVVAILSFLGLMRGEAVFHLGGFPDAWLSGFVFVLSLVGLLKSVYHIVRIEL